MRDCEARQAHVQNGRGLPFGQLVAGAVQTEIGTEAVRPGRYRAGALEDLIEPELLAAILSAVERDQHRETTRGSRLRDWNGGGDNA